MESAFKSGTSHLGRILKAFRANLGGLLLLTLPLCGLPPLWDTSLLSIIRIYQ